jgi:CRP-like cAMP-binding protein
MRGRTAVPTIRRSAWTGSYRRRCDRSCSVTTGSSTRNLDQYSNEITLREAAAGETLFEEGDPTTGVAAVLEGQVDVLRRGRNPRDTGAGFGAGGALAVPALRLPYRDGHREHVSANGLLAGGDLAARLAGHERLATAIVADLAHVLADRLERRTQDVVELLDAVGRRLPLSDLERLRRRAAE